MTGRTVKVVIANAHLHKPLRLKGAPHSEDVCMCGDYRRQHPNGGPSALNWDNPAGVQPCMKFRLAEQANGRE